MARKELAKAYEPWDVEEKWETRWEADKTFTPDPDGPGESYSIVIPPPNVTGVLHMGHALNLTLQDILCRFNRQQGKNVLWVPGTDHAGIATQNVVERQLKEEGLTRDDLGRDKFIERVWEWKKEKGDHILGQIRRIGASVDWTRECFTFDEQRAKAVREVFVKLFEEGLIYKGDYIINWCNRCHTALADDEVEHENKPGHLHHIRYSLTDGSGDLIIATTRPETMLGDTAIAVNPDDDRFNHLIGKTAILPLVGKELPIIGDTYVDIEFGTGCLKVTPAHDMNDWELGRKHDLEVISVLDEKGFVNENAPEKYQGLSVSDARKAVMTDLEAEGRVVEVADHEHSVGVCYRCKSVIEPHVSTQWFVSMKPLAEKARAAVPAETQIFPEHWTKTYYAWLDEIRDWCISRQIWWGHRIPAWTCEECGELIVPMEDPTACPKCGSGNLVQDEDVLDTWFSSALWPFSTLGWPDDTKELARYYPTSCLVTGFDILFFWVARMMMMGLQFKNEVPFKHVYIHALVRDEMGKKMSKSTGNVIDPLDMIGKYGADALRFTLTSFAAMGRDIKLSEQRIEGYKHFMNKIWNATRFAMMNLPDEIPAVELDQADGLANRWILHRLEEVKAAIVEATGTYRFNEIAQILYKFIWSEFCDWYLEMIKPALYGEDETVKAATQKVLWTVLSETMVLLHPVTPFITQEIWSVLPRPANDDRSEDIATLPFPAMRKDCLNPNVVKEMELFMGVVSGTRNIRTELLIEPAKKLDLLIKTVSDEDKAVLEGNIGLIRSLARIHTVTIGPDVKGPKASGVAVVQGNELSVPLEGVVDFESELVRLDKNMVKLDKTMKGVAGKLKNPGFVSNAPAEVVEGEKKKLAEMEEEKNKLTQLKARLESVMG
ncbi:MULTISPECIES: valine--tRNA ligase [unclassified Pseudodesulfovibrio]|uniref:valine--tRNA ligase n=1 Tax=unclassified Pseudodesulfovibrio TaxID=2661612 RepID=UPI000FEB6C9C|nr:MULTISPECIES: valine--tRNA ligase [unclassified Pseudodesulfovibrio]MCJ2165884.1 valine--tRNA ligase [Pseudodesulfovibrio sp. S3-i]RWU02687.1 valine--tRNA ligase [Pseudodesulfovibrio sp. S3]